MRYSESFLLHIRPRFYRPESLSFSATFYLGFLCVFLFVLECITGMVLMVYYAPTPAEAYSTIIRMSTEVPFGSLFRDLHRLGGETMIIAVLLHMGRVFFKGSFAGKFGITWITGIFLLVLTLFLAFSGYLLPWDQLAYWAVTIGTSIAETIPVVGDSITEMLRGGLEMGQNGLLRFYLLHVIVLPLIMLVLLAVHYFRVVRIHPIAKSNQTRNPNSTPTGAVETERLQFFPRVALIELTLSLGLLCLLVCTAAFVYDAPLEHHANPRHTPAATQAPWFFLWLQGALKLGDSFLMGICFPAALLLILLILPYLLTIRNKTGFSPGIAGLVIALSLTTLSVLTYMGLPRFGVAQGPVHELFQELMPEEDITIFHKIGYADLPQGIYELAPGSKPASGSGQLSELLQLLAKRISSLADNQSFKDAHGILIVEDWQWDLKRITLRITWPVDADPQRFQSEEKIVFLHQSG